jgi:hypothetical protein
LIHPLPLPNPALWTAEIFSFVGIWISPEMAQCEIYLKWAMSNTIVAACEFVTKLGHNMKHTLPP